MQIFMWNHLTKFACGNADVLMGALILNENSKISHDFLRVFQTR
jgi:cystathionine beta-lyase/cystathionine gamma-synthase